MAGVCGWIGETGETCDDGAADALIAAMARRLVGGDGQQTAAVRDGGAAVGAASWPGGASVAAHDGLLAAIEGAPRWTDPALATAAAAHGDARALADGWRAHGRGVLDRLAGAFSLAVAEPASGRGLLAIDRFGIAAMRYAALPGGGVAFGSDISAVRAHPSVSATLSPQSLLFYLCFYVIPAPRTVWRGIDKLMAGQYAEIAPGGATTTGFYWRTPYTAQADGDEADLAREMRSRLEAAVDRAVAGHGRDDTAGFLSGGLDSSTVCGYMAGALNGPARAFTIGFADQKYDETPFARMAADRFGLDHRIVRLEEGDVVRFMADQVAAYDEPFGNSSAIPTYFCAAQAREDGASLMLAGDGGDEIFAGNERYLPSARDESYRRIPATLRRVVVSPLLRAAAALGGSTLHARVRRRLAQVDAPMPDRLLADNWVAALDPATVFDRKVLGELDPGGPLAWLQGVWNGCAGSDPLQRFMHLDMQLTLADNDLRKVTRMCELAGCEVRFPMLDEAVVDLAASVPPALLLRDRVLRGFYKRAMAGFLPDGILQKSKHGFGMPFGEWLHGNPTLRARALDCLDSLGGRGLLDRAFLSDVAFRWDRGEPFAAAGAVWDLVVLELWLRRHGGAGTF